MTDPSNPHPIGTLAYWQHCLASLNQRMAEAVNAGMRIKARGLRDDANEARTIIDRIKGQDSPKQPWKVPEGVTEEDLGQYIKFEGSSPSDFGAQAIQVPGRTVETDVLPSLPEPINHTSKCIDCGKLHHGLQGRCRDCKNLYKARSNSPRQERDRLRYQEKRRRQTD